MSTLPTLLTIGGIAVLWAVFVLASGRPRVREWTAQAFLNTSSLPPGPPAIHNAITLYTLRRSRGEVTGLALGLVVALAALLVWPDLGGSISVWFLLFPCAYAGMVLGQTVVAVRHTLFPAVSEAPRVARLRAVTLADYVPPLSRYGATAMAGVAAASVLAAVVVVLVGSATWAALLASSIPLVVISGTVILSLTIWGERAILNHPQPAETTLELAWDDAVRADTFRSLTNTKFIVGMMAASISIAETILLAHIDATVWGLGVGNAAQLSLIVGMLVLIAALSSSTYFLYSRVRLWGEEDFAAAGAAPDTLGGVTSVTQQDRIVGDQD